MSSSDLDTARILYLLRHAHFQQKLAVRFAIFESAARFCCDAVAACDDGWKAIFDVGFVSGNPF